LAILGLGAVFGGGVLIISPSGQLFGMPLSLLDHSPFNNFLVPATMIDKRIEWVPIDSLSAKAIFTNGTNKITATLYFNEQGQLINFILDDRYPSAI